MNLIHRFKIQNSDPTIKYLNSPVLPIVTLGGFIEQGTIRTPQG